MAETYHFRMPLLAPSQAQKHVTVNEALSRIDALARLRVAGILALAPAATENGRCYLVAPGAVGDWAGHGNDVAIRSNGGWTFAVPERGWAAWNAAADLPLLFDGSAWVAEAAVTGAAGAATLGRIIEFDHVIAAGASATTAAAIPGHAMVLAVTARVIAAVTGTGIASFSIGVAADAARYGSGIGLALNSFAKGVTGSPVTYYSDTALVLTPDAGTFGGGTLRLALHFAEAVPPRPV